MSEDIGLLHIGALSGPIKSVTFDGMEMIVICTLGPDQEGEVGGIVRITGMDGSECWRGSREHYYGVKTVSALGPVTWEITASIDITRRDGEAHAEVRR